MKYIAKYLPVEKEITDGCHVVNAAGEDFLYDESRHSGFTSLKAAALFLVKSEFNIDVVVGRPSPDALKWLRPGMEVKAINCEIWWYDNLNKTYKEKVPPEELGKIAPGPVKEVVMVKCPMCNVPH